MKEQPVPMFPPGINININTFSTVQNTVMFLNDKVCLVHLYCVINKKYKVVLKNKIQIKIERS